MTQEMLVSSTGELWALSILLLLGLGFLIFAKAEALFLGMIIVAGVVTIAYGNHERYIHTHFVIQNFHEGRNLSCGLWRGESIKVDPNDGWVLNEGIGFMKGDTIINDVSLCSVIYHPSPEVPGWPYWIAYVSLTAPLFFLRYALSRNRTMKKKAKEEDHDEPRAE